MTEVGGADIYVPMQSAKGMIQQRQVQKQRRILLTQAGIVKVVEVPFSNVLGVFFDDLSE